MDTRTNQGQEIDFVITWVDDTDEMWQKERRKYQAGEKADNESKRYRNWDLLKYWFRGIEKFAPWVRKIHFVTWGHVPEWLELENPKLHIVRHEDYIPQEFLPVFNSNVLEIYMHKIEGLSEKFVYFNDDFFLLRPMLEKDFFVQGKPCDMLAFQPVVANPTNPVMSHLYLNNTLVISKYFNKRENVKKQFGNYFKFGYPLKYFVYNMLEMAFPLFTGFFTVHGPMSFCKSTFETVWEKEQELLAEMSKNRFRSENDVTPYLFREWQKLSGNFKAKNILRDFEYFELKEINGNNEKLLWTIRKQKKKMICINDVWGDCEFEKMKNQLQNAFEYILPEKSRFEKE